MKSCIFRKIFDGEILNNTILFFNSYITILQIFCKIVFPFKVRVKNVIDTEVGYFGVGGGANF